MRSEPPRAAPKALKVIAQPSGLRFLRKCDQSQVVSMQKARRTGDGAQAFLPAGGKASAGFPACRRAAVILNLSVRVFQQAGKPADALPTGRQECLRSKPRQRANRIDTAKGRTFPKTRELRFV